ncbi:MAG: hypothetical protein JNJ54_28405 [Myxococcaceae bacterium]|nr:hypothetical protein [Myxococcaceae bacterium]
MGCGLGFQCLAGACVASNTGVGGGFSPSGGGTAGGSVAGGSAGGSVAGGSAGGSVAGGSAGGSVAGGSAGGSVAGGSAGGSVAGGSAGGGSASCASTCMGCCLNGVCQPGTNSGACGTRGVACFACSTNQFCSAGACTGANTGDTGATCTFNADCKEALLGGATRECVPPYRPDGGPSGWPGGYCSNSGCDSFLDCPGTTGSCGIDGYCYNTCFPANLGQGNCRPGYVCSDDLTVDGGTFALCVPDCRNPGYAGCGPGRTCSPLGSCI